MMGQVTLRVRHTPATPDGPSSTTTDQDYLVETFPRMSVLDALFAIQRQHDRTLSFRYSCRLVMCGTCAVIINDREGLACQTLIERLRNDVVTVRPLNHLP